MAIVYDATVKNARMDALLAEIDGHASPAYIEIGTAGMATVLATITLAAVSGVVTGDTLNFTMPKSDADADASGTAAAARIRDGGGVDKVTGLSVGTTGADINLDSVNITAGQAVTINSGSIQHAA